MVTSALSSAQMKVWKFNFAVIIQQDDNKLF